MTKHETNRDAPQRANPTRITCLLPDRRCLPVLLAGMLGAAPAWASETVTFPLQASGFDTAVVADARGRLVQSGPGRPQRLAPGRWVAVDFQSKTSVWFDDVGRVSSRGPYVELRSSALARHPDDPVRGSLFSAWSQEGTGLLRADGSMFLDWQPERGGEWTITAHPQRYSWRSREAGERIFDQHGQLRLQLGDHELRAAGPFAGRAQYLICDLSVQAPCALRDEAGTTLWTAWVDDLLPLQDGRWLARQGNAWRRLDANGQLDGERDQVFVAGQFLPRARSQADADEASWPRWMTAYRAGHETEDQLVLKPETAVGGLMQADGRFVPVPGASAGREVCPGVWRFSMERGGDRLGDAEGRLGGRFEAHAWREVDARPGLRVAIAADGRETLVDCSGKRLVDTPALIRLTVESPGFVGTLVDETQPRLWLDAALRPHLLPEGSAIDTVSRDGALLAVRTIEGELRLYDVKRERFVGQPFADAEALLPGGVVFQRDGYYGFMDADGRERLPPRYNAITAWGDDRLWSSHYVDKDVLNRQQVSLHGMDGAIIASWMDVTVGSSLMLRALPDEGPVTELLSRGFETAQGNYLGQQWVDREGRTVFLAVKCFGTSKETEGAVIEPLNGAPLRTGADCVIPSHIREAMAAFPQDDRRAAAQSDAGTADSVLPGTRSQPSRSK